jgi:hypothetical protein
VFRHLTLIRYPQGWAVRLLDLALSVRQLTMHFWQSRESIALVAALRLMPDDAAETDVAHPGIDWLRVACGGAITATIVGGAEV